jgi:hypothetical protein
MTMLHMWNSWRDRSFAALESTEPMNLLLIFHMLVTHDLFSTVYLYSMFEGSAGSYSLQFLIVDAP